MTAGILRPPTSTCVSLALRRTLWALPAENPRHLMEELFARPLRGPRLEAGGGGGGAYWVDLDRTVVHFGDAFNAAHVMDAFGPDELLGLRHVALEWCDFGGLVQTCQKLATACPALRTIFVQTQRAPWDWPYNRHVPTPRLAALYTTMLDHDGPDISHGTPDPDCFRRLLLAWFGKSRPRLHLVSSKVVDG
ncbi:hypothetical protein CTA1_12878 [Colletotrichum tanaceti]|uniref:Uncharacterized protein n=1 Tax=Colletotrichum tanaceti TaxID=1306861 RepID=A0A4U6XGA2_9PEZI|nr:hypothetical protein CTA1_12878 [Colletotrichum tanaceti]